MKKNVGFILNFSTSYNANNYLYYYLPCISAGKVLLYDQLTKIQIPSNEKQQESEIKERIKALKNHWDLYLLNPSNSYEKLKINIILDYNPWQFTGFGVLSIFPFAKMNYLQMELKKYFSEYELSKIVFQYFIIKNKAEDSEDFAHYIDTQKGKYAVESSTEIGKINKSQIDWPKWSIIERCFTDFKIEIATLVANDPINDDCKHKIKVLLKSIEDLLHEGFNITEVDSNLKLHLATCVNDFKSEIVSSIIKVSNLNDKEIFKTALERLFMKFSSTYYLRKSTDLLFHFTIDTQTNSTRIRDYESITALIVESIDFFDQNDPINFISCSGGYPVFIIEEIGIDQASNKNLFSNYKAFALADDENKAELDKEKNPVKQFKFNTELNPSKFFELDKKLETKFITSDNLKKKIKPFFSKERSIELKEILKKNSIGQLEDAIKMNSHRTSEMYNLDNDYGHSQTTHNLTYKEIEVMLENFRKEENESNLSSTVDIKKYEKAKSQYAIDIIPLIEEFIDSLYLLPQKGSTLYYLLLSSILVLMLGMPLYTFLFWETALVFALVFSTLLTIVGLLFWLYFRSKIQQKYEAIYLENIAILGKFKEYVNSLALLAVNVRKSTLRRKNIIELEREKEKFLEKKRKKNIYRSFYKEIVEQLETNGHKFDTNNKASSLDSDLPPISDYRNKYFKSTDLTIKANQAEKPYQDLESQLGVINLIKTK